MSKCSTVIGRAAALALLGSLLLAAPSFAHGLSGGYDPGRPVIEYVWLGFWHMLAGWDHLLFIAGILLRPQRAERRAGKSDRVDALAAAKHVLVGEKLSTPRPRGVLSGLRALLIARRSMRALKRHISRDLYKRLSTVHLMTS
jgi:hypothetical protein